MPAAEEASPAAAEQAAASPAPAPSVSKPAEAVPDATAKPAPGPHATAQTWPTWRGDAGQTGRSPATIDPKTLVERWRFASPEGFVSSAVVDDARVYVGGRDGRILALDRHTGALAWAVSTAASVEAPPLRVGDLLIVGSRDGKVRALAAADGAERWAWDAASEVTGAAVWVPPEGSLEAGVIVGAYDGRIVRLDLDDGTLRWTLATGSYVYGSAAVRDGLAVLGGCDGFIHTLKTADGSEVARVPVEAYVGASVAWLGDRAWVGHFGNRVLGFDPRSGEVGWSFFDRSFAWLSSPAITDELVVLGGRDRVLHGIERATGAPAWWFPTRGKVDSSPVLVGPWAVVGSHDGRLYVVDADTGEEVRALDVGGAIGASPAVAGGWVYVGDEAGVFHAFGPPAPPTPKESP